MLANELRIGNLVYDNAGKELIVSHDYLSDTSWMKPIPLTEEWLEKFGFEKDETRHICYLIDSPVNEESYQFRLVGGSFGMSYSYPYDKLKGNVNFAWDIEYVHQLQNLYFALTGTELTVKELTH